MLLNLHKTFPFVTIDENSDICD